MAFETQTYEGMPAGSNLALPRQALDDLEARLIQDALLDQAALVRRRGPVDVVPNLGALSRKASGIVSTIDPAGNYRIGVLNGDGSNGYFSVYNDAFSGLTDIAWPFPLPTAPPSSPYRIVDAKASLTGGALIGVSSSYEAGADQALAFWRGGNKANYTTGTISVTKGAVAVTGVGTTWATYASPGMFLFANTDEGYTNTYVGVVLSVNSDTSITLGAPSAYAIGSKSYTLQSLRGFQPLVSVGRITWDTSTTTVSGGLTKFKSQGLGTGTWNIYRAADGAFIGKVSTVNNDTSMTLTVAPSTSGFNERYQAIRADGNWSTDLSVNDFKPGFLNATYAEAQWFANNGSRHDLTYRLWYTDSSGPEHLDFSAYDGTFIDVGNSHGANTPIKAITSAYNALLVFKEDETFAIIGSSPSNFEARKLYDDGALCGMSVQPFGGGVIWAGRDGIHLYDGVQVTNLTELKLGEYYRNAVRQYDPSQYRMWSMVVRDHYFLHLEKAAPSVPIIKGSVSSTPTEFTIVINMITRSLTFFTNLNVRGFVKLPKDTGLEVWYLVNTSSIGKVCDANYLFDATGVDAFACDGGTTGPDYYVESKAYDMGDGMWMKKWLRLAFNYRAAGAALKVDLVIGLNTEGRTLTAQLPDTGTTWNALKTTYTTWNAVKDAFSTWNMIVGAVYTPNRMFFDRRGTHFAFRIYQASASMTDCAISNYQITYKLLRPGRVA